MKFKNVVRFGGIIILILFFALYFGQFTGYYEVSRNKKNALTNEAIERFENDVREGKKILASNYLEQEKNYNNNLSRLGLGLSKLISDGFDKFMNAVFREIEGAIKK